jgi:hypothetical protein
MQGSSAGSRYVWLWWPSLLHTDTCSIGWWAAVIGVALTPAPDASTSWFLRPPKRVAMAWHAYMTAACCNRATDEDSGAGGLVPKYHSLYS